MQETWYVLEDGTVCNPRDVTADEGGVLRNSKGVAVAMREDGVTHRSRGVDVGEDADAGAKKPAGKNRQVKTEKTGADYQTR